MGTILTKWAVQLLEAELKKFLTPEKVAELLGLVVSWVESQLTPAHVAVVLTPFIGKMREWVKDKTPDFPYDDGAVEILAKALGIP